jgi:hypothetical protein
LGILILLVITACSSGSSGASGDLAIETIGFKPDSDGWTQFYTNDTQYLNDFWTSAWRDNSNQPATDNGTDVYNIECKKISGNKNRSFGFLFGIDTTTETNNPPYYCIYFTVNGAYYIGKYVNGTYITIKDWIVSDNLVPEYGQTNAVKIVKNQADYTVYLNGAKATSFTDSSINGNGLAYRVYIGGGTDDETPESFPNTPVDVRFRQVVD